MLQHRLTIARLWAALALLALLVLYCACAPASSPGSYVPDTSAPSSSNSNAPETPAPAPTETGLVHSARLSTDKMIFPDQVAAEKKQQAIKGYYTGSPNIRANLSEVMLAQHAKRGSSLANPVLNFDASSAVYSVDPDQVLKVQVIGIPVAWTPDYAEKIQTMMMAGAKEDLILGTMHVENDIVDGPTKGDYVFVWKGETNTVMMENVETGTTEESQECVVSNNSFSSPSIEFQQGSLGICIPWDKRSCCF